MRRFSIPLLVLLGLLAPVGCGGDGEDAASTRGPTEGTEKRDNSSINIVGEYTYGSELIGGGTESGRIRIERLGEAYGLTLMPTASPEYYGIGIRNGDHFAICYSLAIERGVGSFVINADGTLTGHWATLGSDGELLSDTWTKVE